MCFGNKYTVSCIEMSCQIISYKKYDNVCGFVRACVCFMSAKIVRWWTEAIFDFTITFTFTYLRFKFLFAIWSIPLFLMEVYIIIFLILAPSIVGMNITLGSWKEGVRLITLTCYVSGDPEPKILWHHHDVSVCLSFIAFTRRIANV